MCATTVNQTTHKTPLPHFSAIKPEGVEEKLTQLLAHNREQLNRLLSTQTKYTWQNLLQPMEDMEDELGKFWAPVRHLNAVANSAEWRAVYNACLPKLSEYGVERNQNAALYKAIQSIADSPEYAQLDQAQKKAIEHGLRDFRLSGVHLEAEAKKRFADLDQELSRLQTLFSENILDATQAWTKLISDKNELAGIPEYAIAAAKQSAEQKQLNGWLFTLEMPSYDAVITNADSRAFRQEIYTAYVTRASDQGPNATEWDNAELIDKILQIRYEMAKLLGFANYAEYSLASKMAKTTDEVLKFLNELVEACMTQAREEFAALQQFAKEKYGIDSLAAWDIPYYSEKLHQQEYEVKKEEFRPYFPDTLVLQGLFDIVQRLYGMRVIEVVDADVWRKEVRLFSFYDAENNLRGQIYIDLYARANKRDGAWMDECQNRRKLTSGTVQTPVAFVTCNFSAPVGNDPALLSHDEVTTLFHEFGHALQHILTKVDYSDVSGINGVPWDAVEIASQFMESWCWEKPGVDLIAKHYQTGHILPEVMFEKLIKAKNFQSAIQMARQLQFALFDFRLHAEFDPAQKNQTQKILNEVRQQLFIFPVPEFNRFQNSFSHIFSGGYAAGYYSYKWAELLACDAFSKFEEQGIFDQQTGKEFLQTFLESGGAVEPMDLFIKFRGRPPKVDALLKQNGIKV